MVENILRWVGGKHTLSPFIIQRMTSHSRYVEVFAGAAHVYWQKPLVEYNTINDINQNLVNLYKVVKYKSKSLQMLEELKMMFYGRDLFNYLRDLYKKENLEGLPDYQRAALFLFVNRASFNGMFTSFAPKDESKIDLPQVIETSKMMFNKLNYGRGTVVENMDFADLIERNNIDNTFFYLDPPYYVTSTTKGAGYYEFVFKLEDHIRLRDALIKAWKTKWLMSYDDVPEIRELYKDNAFYKINTPEVNQSSANRQTGQMGLDTVYKSELLIANYPLENVNTLFE